MSFSAFDYECMALALRQAERGLTTTHPNPRVGCVIADSTQVISSGWHRAAGQAHAEPQALAGAGEQARGATAYVTLEPCAHHGRTAPCTEALAEAGIARVVAAMEDPNPEVSGRGFQRLRDAGIQVEVGLMERQARELNAGFVSRMARGRPWVRVKTAQSLDGRTALGNGDSKWISSEASRLDVQRWRARSDAILTGSATVRADNPRMTVRLEGCERQPLRVVVDSSFAVSPDSAIFTSPRDALVVGCRPGDGLQALVAAGVACEVVADDGAGKVDLASLLKALGDRAINEVQVEAGATLCGALLSAGLVDEILLYQAPCLLGLGAAPAFAIGPLESVSEGSHLETLESVKIGADWRIRLRPVGGN